MFIGFAFFLLVCFVGVLEFIMGLLEMSLLCSLEPLNIYMLHHCCHIVGIYIMVSYMMRCGSAGAPSGGTNLGK